MEEALFGWAHISDIHFGHGDTGYQWDQKLVLRELRQDLADRPTGGRVDAIVVTGDVAFSGGGRSVAEYADARAWLLDVGAALGVGPERILLVPGNHDVNRKADDASPSTRRLVTALRTQYETPGSGLDDSLRHPDDRELLAGRMKGYLELAADFGPWAGKSPAPAAATRLFWTHTLAGDDGLRLRFVGLNSALLCKDDSDKGVLRLGNEQIHEALHGDAAPGEMIVVLTHHPLRRGWLADDDRADAWIRNHTHLHLSGHVHEAESEGARSGSAQGFLRVTAGAAHEDQAERRLSHGYNLAEVRRGPGGGAVLRIYPRLWSPQNTGFVPDVHSIPRANLGAGKLFAEHEIAVTLPAPARPASPSPGGSPVGVAAAQLVSPSTGNGSPVRAVTAATPPAKLSVVTGPVRVFLSYAPADEALCKDLEKHLTLLKRQGLLESFTSQSVDAGQAQGVVSQRLQEAQIILLLLSQDYLASDYCYDVEMETAQRRHDAGEALVIPVWLRELDLHRREEVTRPRPWFDTLQRTPRGKEGEALVDGKPVTSWANRDEAWTAVARDIRLAVARLQGAAG